jgi:hypothetical protein
VLATFDTADDEYIAGIRGSADGSPVFLQLQTVTASYADHFYIEDADRLHGVRVNSSVNPGLGALVSIKGTWQASDVNEDVINATGVRGYGLAACIPKPWALKNRDINGESYHSATAPGAGGPNNSALLVKTWGRVLADPAPANGIFYIDDGSNYPVRISSTKSMNAGDYVTVIGVVGFYVSNGLPQRFLETRTADDVDVINPDN